MRVLLIFAPGPDDPRLAEQRLAIVTAAANARERDLVVVASVGSSDLHERYRVPNHGFAVVLLGKDGGEKWRQKAPATAEQIFAVIDQMPMRRSEAVR